MVAGLNVPVVGPLLMEGFAGGAYSKFRPDPPFNATTIANMECNPNAPTSIPYTYDKTVGLGFKAAIMLKTTGDGFRGRVGFEIVLNRSYGVSSISFYGRGELSAKIPTDRIAGVGNQLANNLRNVANSSPAVSSIVSSAAEVRKKGKQVDDNPGSAPEGNIAFWFGMLWDFENDVMHGEAEAYINIGNVLVGNGPNGRMGWMSMHFAPNSCYIHAGNPQDRLGLKVQIGPVRAQVSSYVMMGHGIPTQLPLPPAQVVNLLNLNTSSSAFQRSTADRDSLTTGSGFALGFDLSIDTGPQQFAMFYGQFGVGAGIDMLLLKRNGISVCGTDAGSNGFYALGQFYAYLQAEVGIRVRQKKFEILSAGVAALMQGGMPNPAWMSGHVGGKFRIFGIKRNFDFNVRLGNECSGI